MDCEGCEEGSCDSLSSFILFSGERASFLPPHVEVYVESGRSTHEGVISRLLLSAIQR